MNQTDAELCKTGSGRTGVSPEWVHGILIVDKPEALSSFQVVKRVAGMLSLSKTGHCGTLDPFATGVLLIAVNQGTRIVDQLTLHDKEYLCTVHFGIETDTLDRTGQVQMRYEGPARDVQDCMKAIESFVGSYDQEVPRFSAVQVEGRRLYDYARQGIDVNLPRRVVTIHTMELVDYEWPFAELRVRCTKGTYVRQLAADIGRKMGCGAHLRALRRTVSGPFSEDSALSLDEIENLRHGGEWVEKVVPLAQALAHLPAVIMEEGLLKRLKDGDLDRSWESEQRATLPEGESPVRVLTSRNQLAALWWPRTSDSSGRRLRVFPF